MKRKNLNEVSEVIPNKIIKEFSKKKYGDNVKMSKPDVIITLNRYKFVEIRQLNLPQYHTSYEICYF